jgi:ATP-dependent Clp protease protease subunit
MLMLVQLALLLAMLCVCSAYLHTNTARLLSVDSHSRLASWRMAPNEPNQNPNDPQGPPKRETTPVALPTVGLGKDQYDVISRLLKDRILLLGSEVNDDVANVMVSQMLYLASADPEAPITIYINSPGRCHVML